MELVLDLGIACMQTQCPFEGTDHSLSKMAIPLHTRALNQPEMDLLLGSSIWSTCGGILIVGLLFGPSFCFSYWLCFFRSCLCSAISALEGLHHVLLFLLLPSWHEINNICLHYWKLNSSLRFWAWRTGAVIEQNICHLLFLPQKKWKGWLLIYSFEGRRSQSFSNEHLFILIDAEPWYFICNVKS